MHSMYYKEVFESLLYHYGLKDSNKNIISTTDLMKKDLDELQALRQDMKNQIKKVDEGIDTFMAMKFDENTKEGKQQAKQRDKFLSRLGQERFLLNRFSSEVHSAYIRKRRKSLEDVSTKALNHGGVYTCANLERPRVGMGFRGYKGITL